MLYYIFGDTIKNEKKLIDLDSVDEVINDYIHENGLNSEEESYHISLIVNLAIDAICQSNCRESSCREVNKDGKSNTFNNGFLYMMIPIDLRLPPKVLHIEKWCNGFYNDFIDEVAENTNSFTDNSCSGMIGQITRFLYDGYTSIDNLPDQLEKNLKLNNVM